MVVGLLYDVRLSIPSVQVDKYTDPREACSAITGESSKLWLEHESRTDDITMIIVHIKDLNTV